MKHRARSGVAVAALALALASAAGAQEHSGYVGAATVAGDDAGVGGAYFMSVSPRLGPEADAVVYNGGWSGAAHLIARDSDAYALGGFVALSDGEMTLYPNAPKVWSLGGEGEVYSESWTWGAAARWDESDWLDSGYAACAYGRFYMRPTLSLDAHASYSSAEADDWISSYSLESRWLGLSAEYMFSRVPFSIRGGVDYGGEDKYESFGNTWSTRDGDGQRILVGARYHFGSSSLKQRDREGAGMPGPSCARP